MKNLTAVYLDRTLLDPKLLPWGNSDAETCQEPAECSKDESFQFGRDRIRAKRATTAFCASTRR
jgi:hypothetical protein